MVADPKMPIPADGGNCHSFEQLPALISKAASALATATTSAEVLVAAEQGGRLLRASCRVVDEYDAAQAQGVEDDDAD